MNDKLYDQIPVTYTLKNIKTAIKNILNNLDNDDIELKDLSLEMLTKMIYSFEKSSLSCRKTIEKYDLNIQNNNSIIYENSELFNEIKVEFDGTFLYIECPFTFKKPDKTRKAKENYIFMQYVESALKNYQNKHQIQLKDCLKGPLTVMIIRNGYKYDRVKICDNDNLENGRIINVIFKELLQSDNAMNMDLYSCFRVNEKQDYFGMQFIVCAQKDFQKAYKKFISGSNDPGF